ncbi:MAG: carboxypeptidase regulatory-like domain-containing protein, partial [Gemmatimonadaceae bacterium]
MLKSRLIASLAVATACLFGSTRTVNAQNVTTGSISGVVTDQSSAPVLSAQIQVTNTQTGVVVNATTREGGRYSVQGLEVGGPYTVSVRRIGFTPVTRTAILVSLSQSTRVDFQLASQAAVLTGITVAGSIGSVISPTKTGTGTIISGDRLVNLPTLSHNFTDFVGIVPQVSNTTGYSSGGGVNIRQNAIQIDGAAAGDLFGLGATGQPGSQANAKAIPLDAVKEYQVLLAPYDVRQGNFGGVLINAVTKSGTNELHGSVYGYDRSQSMTRQQYYLPDYSEKNYGFAVGGPIIKNRAFFYFNSEWRKTSQPASGPFIGSPDAPVNQATIDNFNSLLSSGYGFANGGSGAQVTKQNPATNVFGRVDVYLPFATRLVLRHNYAFANNTSFGRGAATSTSPNFGLTSNAYQFTSKTNSSVAEFLSNFSNGMFNELLLNYTTTKDFRTVPAIFPQVTVRNVPRTDGGTGTVALVAGTEASSQGNILNQRTFELTENFTMPVGAHRFTIGTKDQFYRPYNLFGQNSLGSWTFNSLTDFQSGKPSAYAVSAPSPSDPANGIATFEANMLAYYLQDVWQTTDNLAITMGVRWDQPHFNQTPPSNPGV